MRRGFGGEKRDGARGARVSYGLAKRVGERVERRPAGWRDLPPSARWPGSSVNY
jgi:hypothetical protein